MVQLPRRLLLRRNPIRGGNSEKRAGGKCPVHSQIRNKGCSPEKPATITLAGSMLYLFPRVSREISLWLETRPIRPLDTFEHCRGQKSDHDKTGSRELPRLTSSQTEHNIRVLFSLLKRQVPSVRPHGFSLLMPFGSIPIKYIHANQHSLHRARNHRDRVPTRSLPRHHHAGHRHHRIVQHHHSTRHSKGSRSQPAASNSWTVQNDSRQSCDQKRHLQPCLLPQ